MDANLEYFEKFIVKQIVKKVEYDPVKGEYSFNKFQISDDLIRVIEEEGLRYGMQGWQVREVISRVAENVRTDPYVEIINSKVDVSKLKEGQHLRINITHPIKGKMSVDLATVSKYHFMVLDATVSGLRYGDVLVATDKIWNALFSIEFKVLRNEKRIPDAHTKLLLGKVDSVELFFPPIANEILDSDDTFAYADSPPGIDPEAQKDKETTVPEEDNEELFKKYYIWMPIQWDEPITFGWNEKDVQQNNSTFVVLDSDEQLKSKIQFNPLFKLPKNKNELEVLLNIVFFCCKTMNEYYGIANLKQIKPIKEGILTKTKDDISSKVWVLEKKPQVKFVYGY